MHSCLRMKGVASKTGDVRLSADHYSYGRAVGSLELRLSFAREPGFEARLSEANLR